MYWLLFIGMVAVGLGIVSLFIAELAKKPMLAQEKKAKTMTPGGLDKAAGHAPDDLQVANDEHLERLTSLSIDEKSALGSFRPGKTTREQSPNSADRPGKGAQ